MLCEICNQREVHLVLRSSLGDTKAVHLCEQCAIATSNQYSSASGSLGIDKEMLKVVKNQPLVVNTVYQTQCPKCHLTYTAFKHIGRIGCSECIHSFSSKLFKELILVKDQGQHQGDHPGLVLETEVDTVRELTHLNRALKHAIDAEDYAEAAKIRDKINRLKASGGPDA